MKIGSNTTKKQPDVKIQKFNNLTVKNIPIIISSNPETPTHQISNIAFIKNESQRPIKGVLGATTTPCENPAPAARANTILIRARV